MSNLRAVFSPEQMMQLRQQGMIACGTTYHCAHDPQVYAAISGMATELIQRLTVSENLETQLPEKATE